MNLADKTIAITGANGFIGRHLVQCAQARGAHVVAVVRTPDRARALFGDDVEIRRADLAERDQLATAFRGVDAVIITASTPSSRAASATAISAKDA